MVTAAPSRAICRAMAFPMPLSAPVMIATLFCNRMATSSALVGLSRHHRSANNIPAPHPWQDARSPWQREGTGGHSTQRVVALAVYGRLDELAQALLKDAHVE